MDVYEAIRERFGFELPAVYQRMEQEGFFDYKNPGQRYDPANEPTYLWISEMEWLRPPEILAYAPRSYEKPGFVPFAFTGAGENWCWWPAQDAGMTVLCADGGVGRIDAPDLIGSVYRRCLEHASDFDPSSEEKAIRVLVKRWAQQLTGYFPEHWLDRLRSLVGAKIVEWRHRRGPAHFGLLTHEDQVAIVSHDLAFPRLGEEFEWVRN
jgi:hypothetical protein